MLLIKYNRNKIEYLDPKDIIYVNKNKYKVNNNYVE